MTLRTYNGPTRAEVYGKGLIGDPDAYSYAVARMEEAERLLRDWMDFPDAYGCVLHDETAKFLEDRENGC